MSMSIETHFKKFWKVNVNWHKIHPNVHISPIFYTLHLLITINVSKSIFMSILVAQRPKAVWLMGPYLKKRRAYERLALFKQKYRQKTLPEAQWTQALLLQGGFLPGPSKIFLSIRLHSKSHQKRSKCHNLLAGWHF